MVRLFARKYPLRYAPYRVLRRAEHCTPLARHGLAFSQPSNSLARPPTLGGQALKEILYRTHVIYIDNVSVYIGASKLALHITTDIETGMGRLVVSNVLRSNADAVDGVVQEGVEAIGGG